jgi:putative holliday junction resolvase
MNIMGIDIGDKRIGIALTDSENKFSIPYSIFPNDSKIRQKLENLIKEKQIKKIIVGMPYTLKGDIGKQGKRVIEFVKENLENSGSEIIFYDERYTSKIHLTSPFNRKREIDKFSAASILSDYLQSGYKNIK